jgi:hypothetical protein
MAAFLPYDPILPHLCSSLGAIDGDRIERLILFRRSGRQ